MIRKNTKLETILKACCPVWHENGIKNWLKKLIKKIDLSVHWKWTQNIKILLIMENEINYIKLVINLYTTLIY